MESNAPDHRLQGCPPSSASGCTGHSDIAVGERRPSTPHASRSAVLGIVAAALGVRREDAEGRTELDRCFGFASRTDAPGELLVDFHTAQGPDEKLLGAGARAAKKAGTPWHRPATRKAELDFRRQEVATPSGARTRTAPIGVRTSSRVISQEAAAPRRSSECRPGRRTRRGPRELARRRGHQVGTLSSPAVGGTRRGEGGGGSQAVSYAARR